MRILRSVPSLRHVPRLTINAELLKEQRKQQKMTQQQLADKIGKKREYISNIERGNSDMQLSTFMQIANALGLRFALVVG